MKTFRFASPTKLVITADEASQAALAAELTYEDEKAVQEKRRLEKNPWFVNRYGEEAYQEKLDELEARRQVCLVDPDDGGDVTTLSGFYARLAGARWIETGSAVLPRPEFRTTPYKEVPKAARYYQDAALQALLAARHGAVSLPTGSGKSLIILKAIRDTGMRTLIMAPGESIARQLYDELRKYLGGHRVGLYGDGRKDVKQDVIVGIAASLSRVEPGQPNWKPLHDGRPLFIVDESHLVAAATFKKVALGLAESAVFRFFLSATQFRNDGSDLLLEGLTGPVVYQKDLYELVAEGYLARPVHVCIGLKSDSLYYGPYEDMVEHHLYANRRIHAIGAQLACRFYRMTGLPSLILIDHVKQFALLHPHLNHDVGFAHGELQKTSADGKKKGNWDEVPAGFQKVDNGQLVDRFNDRQLPILVGTSCISTGTDLRPTGAIINLQAGESRIKVEQARGRGTRLVEGKQKFYWVDLGIAIDGVKPFKNPLWRHFRTRCSFYRDPQYVTPAKLGIQE